MKPLGIREITLYTMLQQSLAHILTRNNYLMPYSSHSETFTSIALKQAGLEDAPKVIGLIYLKQTSDHKWPLNPK